MKSDLFSIVEKMQESKIGLSLHLEYMNTLIWYNFGRDQNRDVEKGFDIIINDIIKDNPDSEFSKWYNNL